MAYQIIEATNEPFVFTSTVEQLPIFNIPAGVWGAGRWLIDGTQSGTVFESGNYIWTTGPDYAYFTVPAVDGAFHVSTPVTAAQLTDITAAAGSTVNFHASFFNSGTITINHIRLQIADTTGNLLPDPGPPSCTYSISPASDHFSAAGGTGSTTVTTQTSCPWTATSNVGWLTVNSGTPGTGGGTVGYTCAANAGASRTGTITVAGQTLTVTQDALICTYSLNPTSATVDNGSHTGTVAMTSPGGCAWSPVSDSGWLTITSGTGPGNGTIAYSVASNSGAMRTGHITAGGQTFTLTQGSGLNPTGDSGNPPTAGNAGTAYSGHGRTMHSYIRIRDLQSSIDGEGELEETLLPRQQWRLGEEKSLPVTTVDVTGTSMAGSTVSYLVYDNTSTLLATLTPTINIVGNRLDSDLILTAKSGGTFPAVGNYSVVVRVTRGSTIREWLTPIEVAATIVA